MSSDNSIVRKSLLETISGEPIFVLIATQLIATVLVIGIGYCVVCQQLGIIHYPKAYTPFAIATTLCGLAIGISIAFGFAAFHKAADKITKPLTQMAEAALILSHYRGTLRFNTDSDITEIKQIAKAFNALYDAEERQIDELIDMVRSLMHDIRTPLSHIIGQVEGIESTSSNGENAATLIKNGCHVISRLIDDHSEIMLNYSQLDRAPRESVDISAVVAEGCDLYDCMAETKQQKLTYEVPSHPVLFHGHKRKIQRLLANLIDNSIKYTPVGGKICVTLLSDAPQFTLTVADTGIGIPPSEQPYVFDKNFRGKMGKKVRGLGLGLTMIKSIVSFYDGKISFSSAPNQGTTFTVTLCQDPPSPPCREQTK